MATPKTSFYLTNGNPLVDLYPLESNGPANITNDNSTSGPNESVPVEIIDIDFLSNSITVYGDFTSRLHRLLPTPESLSHPGYMFSGDLNTDVLRYTPAPNTNEIDFNSMVALGLAPGMFIELVQTDGTPIVEPYTQVKSIDRDTQTIVISSQIQTTFSNQRVHFCYPFNIVALAGDPLLSPYMGSYGAVSSTYNSGATTIVMSNQTPLLSASFDIIDVSHGSYGTFTIAGVVAASEIFYPGSFITLKDNSFAQADGSYKVSSAVQSKKYNIKSIAAHSVGANIGVAGNIGPFFGSNSTTDEFQLTVEGNTTHSSIDPKLNGIHNIVRTGSGVLYNYDSVTDTTFFLIGTSVNTGASENVMVTVDGQASPRFPTAIITIDSISSSSSPENLYIDGNTTATGILSAGGRELNSSIVHKQYTQKPIASPPPISTVVPGETYNVTWRVEDDLSHLFSEGQLIVVKNNNYFPYKRLEIAGVNVTTVEVPVEDASNSTNIIYETKIVTELLTVVHATTMPDPGPVGSIVFPPPAMPYGHMQYTVLTAATPLQLVGRGVTHYNSYTTWGQALQNNAIHQLENFANLIAPQSPLEGQLWYNPTVDVVDGHVQGPVLNLYTSDNWSSLVIAGLPVQTDVDMNGFLIKNLADISDDPAHFTGDLSLALNVRSADGRYVNVTGDVMTGNLSMTTNKIVDLADTDIPTGTSINTSTPNGQDALNVRTADARYVNVDGDTMIGVLNMSNHSITNVLNPTSAQDAATKSYVDSLSSGIVWLQPLLDPNLFDDTLSSPPNISDPDMLFYRSYYVKPAKYDVTGMNNPSKIWSIDGNLTTIIHPGDLIAIRGNTDAATNKEYNITAVAYSAGENQTHMTVAETIPSTAIIGGYLYHAVGSWSHWLGRIVSWNGSQWVDVLERAVKPGDRFGVYFEVDNDETSTPTPGGSFAVGSPLGTATKSAAGKIVTVNAIDVDYAVNWGSSPGSTYVPQTPMEPDAVSVLGVNSSHYGHSYTFRGSWGQGTYNQEYKWIEFAGPSMLVDGAGLKYSGNILNVGQGTGITVTANSVSVNTAYLNTNYMRRDGAYAFTGDISMGNHSLLNLSDPVNNLDAVNLQYLNDNFMSLTSMNPMEQDLDMGGNQLINVGYPVLDTDAATKAYADTKLSTSGGTMTGVLSMSSSTGLAYIDMGTTNKIVNLADATNATDAVNLRTADGRYVNTSGDTMTGFLTLHAAPTNNMHASTKKYVDDTVSTATTAIQAATIDGGAY